MCNKIRTIDNDSELFEEWFNEENPSVWEYDEETECTKSTEYVTTASHIIKLKQSIDDSDYGHYCKSIYSHARQANYNNRYYRQKVLNGQYEAWVGDYKLYDLFVDGIISYDEMLDWSQRLPTVQKHRQALNGQNRRGRKHGKTT